MGVMKQLMIEALDDAGDGRDPVRFADAQLQLQLALGYNKQNAMYECRYEERNDEFTIKRWRDGHEDSSRGLLIDLPDWLARIRDVATVGGHLKRVIVPPPDNIIWFTTDDDNNLINFMELK